MTTKKPPRRSASDRKRISAQWREALPEKMSSNLTFSELWDIYIFELSKKGGSVKEARIAGDLYILPAFGSVCIGEITTPDVVAWVKTLRPHMAAKYCRTRHAFMRAALELARSRGAIVANPASRLPPGTVPPNETRPGFDPGAELLRLEDVIRLLSSERIPLYRRLRYGLLSLTGARSGEIQGLRWRDLSQTEILWQLRIERAWSRGQRREKGTKTGSIRTVPVHPELLLPLIAEMRGEGWFALYSTSLTADDLIAAAPSKRGEPHRASDSSLLEWWVKDLQMLGLRRRRLHSLRHWFISTLIGLGVDERTVRSMTHAPEVSDAFDLYAHTSWEAKCNAILTIKVQLGFRTP